MGQSGQIDDIKEQVHRGTQGPRDREHLAERRFRTVPFGPVLRDRVDADGAGELGLRHAEVTPSPRHGGEVEAEPGELRRSGLGSWHSRTVPATADIVKPASGHLQLLCLHRRATLWVNLHRGRRCVQSTKRCSKCDRDRLVTEFHRATLAVEYLEEVA